MNWKSLPHWLRGGVIGVPAFLILLYVNLVAQRIIPVPFLFAWVKTISLSLTESMGGSILILGILLIEGFMGFIMGSLIGLIYGGFKK